MRKINKIIVHCSATPPSMDIGVAEIRKWHVQDNKWSDIGYHYVIRRDGTVEKGRPIETPGAHTQGHNANSIGVCLVGGIRGDKEYTNLDWPPSTLSKTKKKGDPENNFTLAQNMSLVAVLTNLRKELPGTTIHGHNEFAKKACPSFTVRDWLQAVGIQK